MKHMTFSAKLISFSTSVILLVFALCVFGYAQAESLPCESAYGWNVYTENNSDNESYFKWMKNDFQTYSDTNSYLNFMSPCSKYFKSDLNEGAKILAVAQNQLPLYGMKICLDITKTEFPCDKSAFSIGLISDSTVSAMPANNSECLKGLAAVATGENDVVLTFNQIVLNTQTILNKASIYVGGIEMNSAILNWIVSTDNSDLTVSFDVVGGGTMGSMIYECSITAHTHSGLTAEDEGITVQKIRFTAPGVIGYPAVFSGSYGDNTYACPDFTIKHLSCNCGYAQTADYTIYGNTETVPAAKFKGYYTTAYIPDESKPSSVVFYYTVEMHLVGFPTYLYPLDGYVNEEEGISSEFEGWYYKGQNLGYGGMYYFSETGYQNITGKWKTTYIKPGAEYRPSVSTYGVTVTVNGLEGVKDFFIAKGHYSTYREIKNSGSYISVTSAKFSDDNSYTYGSAIGEPGEYTILLRYNDSSIENKVLYFNCEVKKPVINQDGRIITISLLDDVKVVRIAKGVYNTPRDVKNGTNARGFSAKAIANLIDENGAFSIMNEADYTGTDYTVYIEYNNKYSELHNIRLYKKTAMMHIFNDTIMFYNLNGMTLFRYAKGEYTTAQQVKKAPGSRVITPDKVTDDIINLTNLHGTYTFFVQFDDLSQNFFTFTFK